MRFRSIIFALGVLALGLGLPTTASAQTPTGPYFAGSKLGSIDLSQGTDAATFTSASFKDMTSAANAAAALGASLRFSECTIRNTHATQTLYLGVAAYSGAGPSTTNRIAIGPGAVLTIPLYGIYPTSISLDGSGAATTGQAICFFVTR